eukprot:12433001-Prorocentrum_lima.AAC.1
MIRHPDAADTSGIGLSAPERDLRAVAHGQAPQVSFAVNCRSGRHRSVVVADLLQGRRRAC